MAKTWVKIDDDLPFHPKMRDISAETRWVYVASICYAAHNLTDGLITPGALALLSGTRRTTTALVAAGLWEVVDGGWMIHDYLKHNRSREQALGYIEQRRTAGEKGRRSRYGTGESAGEKAGKTLAKPLAKASREAGGLHLSASLSSSSSSGVTDDFKEGVEGDHWQNASEMPERDTGFNERMGLMILANDRISRDDSLYDDAKQIAEDYTYTQIQNALREQKRSKDAQGRPMGPYPSNWRRFLIPDGRRNGNGRAGDIDPYSREALGG